MTSGELGRCFVLTIFIAHNTYHCFEERLTDYITTAQTHYYDRRNVTKKKGKNFHLKSKSKNLKHLLFLLIFPIITCKIYELIH